jgi:hypothetical protein
MQKYFRKLELDQNQRDSADESNDKEDIAIVKPLIRDALIVNYIHELLKIHPIIVRSFIYRYLHLIFYILVLLKILLILNKNKQK